MADSGSRAIGACRAAPSPRAAFRELLGETRRYVKARASRTVDDVAAKLDAADAPHGAPERAAYEGVKALVVDDNPVWGAVKGAWLGASGATQAAVVVSLLLMLLLAPVLLVVFLLGLLAVGVVAGVRAAVAHPAR